MVKRHAFKMLIYGAIIFALTTFYAVDSVKADSYNIQPLRYYWGKTDAQLPSSTWSQLYLGSSWYGSSNPYGTGSSSALGPTYKIALEYDFSNYNYDNFTFLIAALDNLNSVDNGSLCSIQSTYNTNFNYIARDVNIYSVECKLLKNERYINMWFTSTNSTTVVNQIRTISNWTFYNDKNVQVQQEINNNINSVISGVNDTNKKLDDTNKNIKETNDTIKDSSTDDPSGSVSDWNSKTASNGTITDLITLPITLFTNILNNINGRCTTFNLGSLFGNDLQLPCINVANYVGSALWSVIDVLFSGLFVLVIGKKMIKIFNNFTMMKEGDVLD